MPRRQKPNIEQRDDGWYFRLRAPEGHPGPIRPRFGPFRTERLAEKAGWAKLDEFDAWDPGAPPPIDIPTIDALADEFLEQQYPMTRAAYTRKCLVWNLNRIRRDLGGVRVDRLDYRRVSTWRQTLPAGSAWHVHQALRQLLNYAVKVKLVAENPAREVPNPKPTRRPGREKVETFTLDELDGIAQELPAPWRAIPHFAAGTGLRPEEWIALEWGDVDLTATPSVSVSRAYTRGELKGLKTANSERRVPLRAEALNALREHPRRLGTKLVFTALRKPVGEAIEPYIDLHSFREVWNVALDSAGIARRVPYALRHTYATTSLAAGIPTFNVARRMGTSLQMIEETYGHLAPTSEAWEVALLDEYDAAERAKSNGSRSDEMDVLALT